MNDAKLSRRTASKWPLCSGTRVVQAVLTQFDPLTSGRGTGTTVKPDENVDSLNDFVDLARTAAKSFHMHSGYKKADRDGEIPFSLLQTVIQST